MANEIKKPRGTTDSYGTDQSLYEGIRKLLLDDALLYGAKEMDVPMFEELRLFNRTVGESSDIVSKETFDLVKKGDKQYALRPEYTASINRAVLENKLYASPDLPLRISYCGPVFRYDRPQAGRLREFHQFGIEFLDTKLDLHASLDALLLAVRACEHLLDKKVIVKLNFLGSFSSREKYKVALKDYFTPRIKDMCEDCQRRLDLNPLRILDCKVESDQKIAINAPRISDYLIDEDKAELDHILKSLDELGISYQFDDGLVRGLDYYTGLVFELYDASNLSIGAIGGGGKYANLMKDIGGPRFEGIGFSLGIERLTFCLDEKRKAELINDEDIDVFIIPKKGESRVSYLAEKLRSQGLKVTYPSSSKGLGGAFKMADRLKAKYVIIEDEDNYKLKNMESREQEEVSLDEILERKLKR